MMTMYNIREIADIYVDAIVADENNNLLFLSAWGLDTVIQEFLAKLSIANHEGGLKNFHLSGGDYPQFYRVLDAACLEKLTGRMPNKESNFNNLVHLYLHDRLATQIDYANRRCLLLKRQSDDDENFSQQLWQTVQSVCPVPLLQEWHFILGEFQALGWIKKQVGVLVDAYQIDFSSDDVETHISHLIKIRKLALPKKASHLSLLH